MRIQLHLLNSVEGGRRGQAPFVDFVNIVRRGGTLDTLHDDPNHAVLQSPGSLQTYAIAVQLPTQV